MTLEKLDQKQVFPSSSWMEMQSPLSSYSVGKFSKLFLQPKKH